MNLRNLIIKKTPKGLIWQDLVMMYISLMACSKLKHKFAK